MEFRIQHAIQGISIEKEKNLKIASPLFSRPYQFDMNVLAGHSYTIILYFLSFDFSTQRIFHFDSFPSNMQEMSIFSWRKSINFKTVHTFFPLFPQEFQNSTYGKLWHQFFFINAVIFGDTLDMINSFKRQFPFIFVCVSLKKSSILFFPLC